MKQIKFLVAIMFSLCVTGAANAQTDNSKNDNMKTYVIEREIPNAGKLSSTELKSISQSSCSVLKEMNGIKWVHSYVTGNKIYCIYEAENKQLVLDHAKRGGFPANSINEVAAVISPASAE